MKGIWLNLENLRTLVKFQWVWPELKAETKEKVLNTQPLVFTSMVLRAWQPAGWLAGAWNTIYTIHRFGGLALIVEAQAEFVQHVCPDNLDLILEEAVWYWVQEHLALPQKLRHNSQFALGQTLSLTLLRAHNTEPQVVQTSLNYSVLLFQSYLLLRTAPSAGPSQHFNRPTLSYISCIFWSH